jgi:hypothetical protein
VIRYRKAEVTVYGKNASYPFSRIAFRANSKRQMKSFKTYSEAKAEAEKKARELQANIAPNLPHRAETAKLDPPAGKYGNSKRS